MTSCLVVDRPCGADWPVCMVLSLQQQGHTGWTCKHTRAGHQIRSTCWKPNRKDSCCHHVPGRRDASIRNNGWVRLLFRVTRVLMLPNFIYLNRQICVEGSNCETDCTHSVQSVYVCCLNATTHNHTYCSNMTESGWDRRLKLQNTVLEITVHTHYQHNRKMNPSAKWWVIRPAVIWCDCDHDQV